MADSESNNSISTYSKSKDSKVITAYQLESTNLRALRANVLTCFLLESMLQQMQNGAYIVGYGPSQGKLAVNRSGKNVEIAAKIGQDIVDFGVSLDVPLGAKRSLFTTKNEGCNPTKKKRNDEVLFLKRMCTAEAESSILKIKNIKNVNSCN